MSPFFSRSLFLKTLLSLLLCAFLLGGGLLVFQFLLKNGPKVAQDKENIFKPLVHSAEMSPALEAFSLEAQGQIISPQQTPVSAQVSGKVEWVSPLWQTGASLKQGDCLLKIEDIDYQTEKTRLEANVKKAQYDLANEEALAAQAKKEWQRNHPEPSAEKALNTQQNPLLFREPQLAAAQAALAAQKALLLQAENNIQRTQIRAPYDCQLVRKSVDLGAYVAPGTLLAELIPSDKRELRLPLSLLDFAYLKKNATLESVFFQIRLLSEQTPYVWQARLSRLEPLVEKDTQSLTLLAEIAPNADNPPAFRLPPVGLFVNATLIGAPLADAWEVPASSVRGNEEVWIIDEKSCLQRQPIQLLRRHQDKALIQSKGEKNSLKKGQKVCTTLLEAPIEGMPVEVVPQSNGSDT